MAVRMAQFLAQSSKAGLHTYVAISPSACKPAAGAAIDKSQPASGGQLVANDCPYRRGWRI